ncbi:helix-turn-helix domain-containing protein [Micromonospora sp. NBC_00421]|uniref:helix-turn-helix domain-containing protein n=1 Tax=Micromonospora sp. NBC_00421 TaxID=2975976 RepID=UPI002E21F8A2
MTGLLTSDQAAALIGISRHHVPAWTAARRIHRVADGRRYLYPAAAIRAALAPRPALAAEVQAVRFTRFVRNPLNRVA